MLPHSSRRKLSFLLLVSHGLPLAVLTMLWCHMSLRIIHTTFTEELNATDQKTDNEKADMRIVQAAAQEVTAS